MRECPLQKLLGTRVGNLSSRCEQRELLERSEFAAGHLAVHLTRLPILLRGQQVFGHIERRIGRVALRVRRSGSRNVLGITVRLW